jgi:aldose 1-epimerase
MDNVTTIGQIDGADVHLVSLSGPRGLRLAVLSWGARLAELWVPDRNGVLADIVLGHDSLADWQAHGRYLGAICGRYSNRIAGGRFTLDGRLVQVHQNEGTNHLHGGAFGFDRKVWQIESRSDRHVTFATDSPNGEMGYTGFLTARATYRISELGLEIVMEAGTDAPTVVNMVNHAYFNLAGQGAGDVMEHELQIDAGFYLPVDRTQIPTGEVLSVTGTAFDFRTARAIGASLPGPSAFDHNFCLSSPIAGNGLRPCLVATDPASGRRMRLTTTEPGVQIYTGAHFAGAPGKAGTTYPRFAGFAAETQRFPDSPNNPHFPSARLAPGEVYTHRMGFDFTPA